ncbi:MAG: hypothetical protein CVV13_06055 [Gammaproteobacteria bacterium HGW-Gammaproteobacteria-3]|nr:MAG: hypothetical protein CVV13_06055 [Gammaproteobacteria bacterium HGW-Gammaproteobacteria-3]
MTRNKSYLNRRFEQTAADIVESIDRDVERGEDILMLGFGSVMMSTFFAVVVPPSILLPIVALIFAVSASLARINYFNMERKLKTVMAPLGGTELAILRPIAVVFAEQPMPSLTHSFNPLKNLPRAGKSLLGGLLINPLWMPIFYTMGLQIHEEKNLVSLNKAVMGVEQNLLLRAL